MELLAKTYSHLSWQFRTFRGMLVRVPFPTVLGIGAQVLARFAQLAAFFLPLKVLIMLSSHHVSRAFTGVITSDSLNSWIIGFSIATLVLYATSVFLTTVGNRTITNGVDALLQPSANLSKDEKRKLRRLYSMYCYAASDAIIFLLGALIIAFINPLVLIGMILVVVGEIIITGIIINSTVGGFLGWIRDGIGRNVKAYIQYLSAANFLALFLLIIADFFIQGGLNVYTAILTMILGRLTFSSLAKFVRRMLALGIDDEEDD